MLNVTPKLGDTLYPDDWGHGSYLAPCEWDAAEFRVPSGSYSDMAYPVRLRVTGRTVQRKHGACVVRVEITWVHDGEPNTVTGGYLVV